MTTGLPACFFLASLACAYICEGQTLSTAALPATAPGPTRLDVLRMLRGRDFERLDLAIRSLQEAVERDIRQELALLNAMSAFDSTDPAITALLDEWVKASPGSYPAHLASAEHAEALAWKARGTDWSDRTSTEQLAGMTRHFGRMVLEVEAALRLNPRLTVAVAMLISAARTTNDGDCTRLFERFYDEVGASFAVRRSLAVCLLPRWQGSYRALDALAEEAAARAGDNPRLRLLAGMVAWDRGRTVVDDDPARAAQLYTEALQHGSHGTFLLARSRARYDQRRHNDALTDIEQALRLTPHDTEALMLRAWNLRGLGRLTEAAADVRLVMELDPLDDMLVAFREDEIEAAVAAARQRISEGGPEAAILRLNDGVALVGEDANILYWRGRAKLAFKDKAGALTDLQRAVQMDARNFDALLGIDFILTERGQFLDVIRYWTDYLALEPGHGKALLARANAHVARGDVKPGLEDAKAACRAGQQMGCALVTALDQPLSVPW